jgi:hypothetical protein
MPDINGNGNDLIKAGDYSLTKLNLISTTSEKSIDITNIYTKIELFEDLFSPYMTGQIKMSDTFNIPELLPITGQEILEIEFKTAVENIDPISKTFRVYKMDKHGFDLNGKGQQYTLHIISEGGLINYANRCGYHVSGSVSEMISKIVTKHLPSYLWENRFEVEDTKDKYSFVLPRSFTPFKAISWLANKAINSNVEDYSPFFFYETFDGYKFKSLQKIIKDGSKSIQDYYFIKNNSSNADGSPTSLVVDGPLGAIFHKVQNLEEINRFNMAENIMEGTVSSRLIVHDLMRKQSREQIFREDDVFETATKLGTEKHYKTSKKDDQFFLNTPCSYNYLPSTSFTVYDPVGQIVDNVRIEEYFLKRKYAINSIMTQKLAMDIYGDSTKRVGQVINLYVPKLSADQSVQEEKSDKNFSGSYLITSIRHTFANAYSCRIELSRNGMGV